MSTLLNWNNDPEQWLTAQNVKTKKLLSSLLLRKDIWHTIDDLELTIKNQHERTLTFTFKDIKIEWFKILVKLYALVRLERNYSINYVASDIRNLRRFSKYLEEKNIVKPEWINEQIFDEFDYYLRSTHISERTISLYHTTLKVFFNTCRLEKWLDINTYWFKGRLNGSSFNTEKINYIPEEVWNQLEQNLHNFPEPIQRKILIIRTLGLRIGELLNLPFDCLRKRRNKWYLRLKTEKYDVEDEIPICKELVAIIREQQEFVLTNFDENYKYLFCSNSNGSRKIVFRPVPRVMSLLTFNNWLNKLGRKYNIVDKNNKLWHFKSHQFRKTVATVMTNSGVRDLIIQKYLRHRSPDMQNYYKHLLKQVIGDEYQELMKETRYVDSTGKIVATHKPNNPITELMRRKMYQITTQYGECHRPVLKSSCQTVNACWRCEHWRTSGNDLNYLEQDLSKIKSELKTARKLGMIRQQQGLEQDYQSLNIRIKGLVKKQ